MRDVNTPLLKVYFTALTGITVNSISIPVYSGILPDNINPDNYILFGEITNTDLSTKGSSDTNSLIRVSIHTFGDKYNSPLIANSIANEVFQRIYPYTQFNLDLSADNLQMVSTELANETTEHLLLDANRAFINRFITFRHKIYIC